MGFLVSSVERQSLIFPQSVQVDERVASQSFIVYLAAVWREVSRNVPGTNSGGATAAKLLACFVERFLQIFE